MGIDETIVASIISVVIVSYLGFHQYLKQRRREEINEYYIKNGIDKIIESLDNACFNCQFNYAKAMRIIEYLEKFPANEKLNSLISKIFSEMQPSIVAPSTAIYKIQLLTGQQETLLSWIIMALADYLKYNDYLRHELFLEVSFYLHYPERFQGKEKQFIETIKNRIIEIDKNIVAKNENLKPHLLNLKIRIDEIGISSMKDFDKKILKDKRIKEILNEVEKDYQKLE